MAASAAARNGKSDPDGKPDGVSSSSRTASSRFLQSLADYKGVVFVSHVHPDPDSLGSMMGLAYLVRKKLKLPTIVTQDGFIGRAENQAMVQSLNIELTPIEKVDLSLGYAFVMVDSQPDTGRHTLPVEVPVHAVIDHHEFSGDTSGVNFVDVRSGLGATCTLVTHYLKEQRATPPKDVATALFYGVESELQGYPREASPQDDGALLYLFEHADKDVLAQIKSARLPLSYFETLTQALQSSFIYDKLIISWVDELSMPELAAEIADFLIRFEEVEWAFCCGVYKDNLVMSARTVHANGEAGLVLQEVVGSLGRAGGHDRRAGGAISLESTAESTIDQLRSTLRKRLLNVLDIDEQRGQRLVSRKELLENLQG